MESERRSDAETFESVTADAFLGGALTVRQPVRGYRAGLDAVMLAAAVPAQPGERAIEFGTGVGTSSLCLLWRVAGFSVTGIEAEASFAALARHNAHANGFSGRFDCISAVLPRVPNQVAANSLDHVFFNPPYGEGSGGTLSPHPSKARATAMVQTMIGEWVRAAMRLLKPGGRLTVIHRAEALTNILEPLQGRAGAIEIIPLWPRAGAAATRIVIRARKAYRTPLTVHSGLCLHGTGGGFTPEAEAILRRGGGLFV